ncbi:helix-turn-helix domain-containing protein [Arcanobacterium buesumense]
MSLICRKHRWYCPSNDCAMGSWTSQDKRIASRHCRLTTRAAKWATRQVGMGRTISEVAGELGCDWHTINHSVTIYGQALLDADRKRLSQTSAIGS